MNLLRQLSLHSTPPPSASHLGLSVVLEKSLEWSRVGCPQPGENKCRFHPNSDYGLGDVITNTHCEMLENRHCFRHYSGFLFLSDPILCPFPCVGFLSCLSVCNFFFPPHYSFSAGRHRPFATLINKHVRSTTKNPFEF